MFAKLACEFQQAYNVPGLLNAARLCFDYTVATLRQF